MSVTLFRREEISGGGICDPYLIRWRLFRWGGFAVYLHHFVGDDWSRDLHDHPKRFVSIGLRGSYLEETPLCVELFRAPWFRSFPATHQHRIRLNAGTDCWTLVFVGRAVRQWGFWHGGSWIPWRDYVGDLDLVAQVKTCE